MKSHSITRLAIAISVASLGMAANASTAADVAPTVHAHSEVELMRMNKFLDERIDRTAVRKSLVNAKGRKIDCVDINAQPALKNVFLHGHVVELAPRSAAQAANLQVSAKMPAAQDLVEPLYEIDAGETGAGKAAAATLRRGTCAPGTVPIAEVTSDDLKRFATLEDFFAKSPGAARRPEPRINLPWHSGPSSNHQYAHAYRYVANWGAQATINIWKSATELNTEFSLGQIWVVGGTGAGLQTLEVGTQKYHNLYNDDNAHLFIYSTRANYAPNTGCYNNTCGDFVQVSTTIFPGAVINPPSILNGTQYETSMQWFKDMDGGAWWLNYQGQWVGYYPRALYNAAGVQNHAAEIDFGGEIIDNRNGGRHTTTDMGSGGFPSAGYKKAAYMRLLNYNYATTTNPNKVWNTPATGLTLNRSDAACYDIAYFTGDVNWGSYFYYGGAGYDYNLCH